MGADAVVMGMLVAGTFATLLYIGYDGLRKPVCPQCHSNHDVVPRRLRDVIREENPAYQCRVHGEFAPRQRRRIS
jgi:hypothetical protein